MQVNRVFLLMYDLLVLAAFVFRFVTVGPYLFNHVWTFWGAFVLFGFVLCYMSYSAFSHPTPLEVVSYHINLIMRHTDEEADDEEYFKKSLLYLSERFVESEAYDFFYFGDCCAKLNEYSHMKIKLAIGPESFNQISMIIQTMDQQYIKFDMVKNTSRSSCAFLYDWTIDQIEYSDQIAFLEMVDGQE